MNSGFSYIILFLFITAKLFCQDIIVKSDSSKIISKIIEVNPQEIKYNRSDIPSGPIFIINKNDVAYVIYSNGVKEVFMSIEKSIINNSFSNIILLKEDIKKPDSIGNYIKFNVQLGGVINSLSTNYRRREPPPSHTSSEEYSSSSNKYTYNCNLGFNFLFGKSPYIKHVIGVNYLRSTGEFNYSFGSLGSSDGYGGYSTYSENYHYTSKIDFINIVTGLHFKIFKTLHIEPLISVNITAETDVRCTGYNTTKYTSGGPTPTVYKEETVYFSNKKVSSERAGINSTVSLCPKICYEFPVKKQHLGVYISYNLAYEFRLPWYMAGITYYPFKKLR